ncbi:hypothetical protein V6N13_065098 [Hibiscus sabdariffa]
MASLNTLALLSIFLLLLLHLKIVKSDLLSPLLSPLFDDVCKEVECGRGKCQSSLNGTLPFYICECDPGWKQTFSDKDDHQHLKFLPCIVPNCTVNSACSDASSPVQEKETKMNQSVFDIGLIAEAGRAARRPRLRTTVDVRRVYFNLLNVSSFACYKECAIGTGLCQPRYLDDEYVYFNTADTIGVLKMMLTEIEPMLENFELHDPNSFPYRLSRREHYAFKLYPIRNLCDSIHFRVTIQFAYGC